MPKSDYTTKLQAKVDQFVNRWIRVGRSGRAKAETELYKLIDSGREAQISTVVDGYESLVDAVVQENKPLEHRTASASIVLKVAGADTDDEGSVKDVVDADNIRFEVRPKNGS